MMIRVGFNFALSGVLAAGDGGKSLI